MIQIFHQSAYLPLFRHTSDCQQEKKIQKILFNRLVSALSGSRRPKSASAPNILKIFFANLDSSHYREPYM